MDLHWPHPLWRSASCSKCFHLSFIYNLYCINLYLSPPSRQWRISRLEWVILAGGGVSRFCWRGLFKNRYCMCTCVYLCADLGSNTLESIWITNTNTIQLVKYKYKCDFFSLYLKYKYKMHQMYQIWLQILSPHTSYFMVLSTLIFCEDNKYNEL